MNKAEKYSRKALVLRLLDCEYFEFEAAFFETYDTRYRQCLRTRTNSQNLRN